MPSFNLRLNSPTSASKHIEVAIFFSWGEGTVIELNNSLAVQHKWLRGFNVSWISTYMEESERLFFGGFYFIKTNSIRLFTGHRNYATAIQAMYYLDTMLTGGQLLDVNGKTLTVENQDVQLIKSLFSNVLQSQSKSTLDHYIFRTFQSFVTNKQQIILNLPELAKANKDMRDLIMYSLEERNVTHEQKTDSPDMINIGRNNPRSEIFETFRNVKSLIIQTSSSSICYSLSLMRLLSLIQDTSVEQVIVKAITHDNTGNNWLRSVWDSSWIILKEIYAKQDFVISVKSVAKSKSNEYWFVVNSDEMGCSNALNIYLDTIDTDQIEIKENYQHGYNFGVRFSYWQNGSENLYCKSKHKDLKKEVLSNSIHTISMKQWNAIFKNAEELLTNNAFKKYTAKYIPNSNEYYDIQCGTKISLNHLIAILLCHDSIELLSKARDVCIRNETETMDGFKNRHSEYANWFKLLAEAITFYGSNLSRTDHTVYHFLTIKAYFNRFKGSFNFPLAATSNPNIGRTILKGGGIMLELGGVQSDSGWKAPYFDVSLIAEESKLPFKNEYLFFQAELEIKYVHTKQNKYNLAPLCLYESIVSADKIVSLPNIRTDELFRKDKPYGFEMLKMCIEKNKTKHMDKKEIMNKIFHKQLREKFLKPAEEKTNELVEADQFIWHPTKAELNQFITDEIDSIDSQTMQTSDGAKFYCQMIVREHKTKRYAAISLNLFQLLNNINQ
eukprot:479709_1